MGDEWKKRLNDQGYKNWLKVTLALIESKVALHDFTANIIKQVHNDIKSRIGSAGCTAACRTNKGKPPTCSNCLKWVQEIKNYSAGSLNWKNADPKIWHAEPWEIAKCYMNAQGNPTTAAANTGPDKTDLSGILNVLVNCKEFRNRHFKEKKLPEHVRTVRNKVMHCPTMSFSDKDMMKMVDQVIALLEDEQELKDLSISKDKVKVIKSIRDKEFELKQKHENLCIGAALDTHTLAADSGEEIDEETTTICNNLVKLIMDDNDLKKKFEDKIININKKLASMKQEYDAEFSAMKINIGELTGRIESLEKLTSRESLPSNRASSIPGIKSWSKNALQSYAQKKKRDLPQYVCNEPEKGKFFCTVSFNGKKFSTKEFKRSKREAEQTAAEEVLNSLADEDEVVSNKNTESPTTHNDYDGKMSEKKEENYKNMLQEKTHKEKIHRPIYNTTKTDSGFLSQVMYNDNWYSPDVNPQKRKVDAEQKAAQFAFLAILDREKKEDRPADSSTLRLEDVNDGSRVNSTKNAVKSFRVILNEHVQKITKGQLPDYDTEKNSEGKYICSCTVFGKIYSSPSGENSKPEAKETAAREACKALGMGSAENGTSPSKTADSCPQKEETPATEGPKLTTEKAIANVGNTARNILTERNSATTASNTSPPTVDKPDGKTWKSKLNEYAQKMRGKPEYVPIQDSTTKEYLSKVYLGRRCFKGKQPEVKIKEAENHVAEIALNILEGRSDTPNPRCKELLKEYHKNHCLPSYPKYEEGACDDDGKFIALVRIKKMYKFWCKDKKTKKKDVEIWLAEQAVEVLEKEGKITRSEGDAKSRLNTFLQLQDGDSQLKYDVQGSQAEFTGCLSFYGDDVYESLCSQNSKEEAIASAAMSACNGMDL